MFVCADKIALAVVTAARLTGDNPLEIFMPNEARRTRGLACVALQTVYPNAKKAAIGRCVGYMGDGGKGAANAYKCKDTKWWREEWLDEVIGTLVGEEDELPAPAVIEPAAKPPAPIKPTMHSIAVTHAKQARDSEDRIKAPFKRVIRTLPTLQPSVDIPRAARPQINWNDPIQAEAAIMAGHIPPKKPQAFIVADFDHGDPEPGRSALDQMQQERRA